MKKIKPKSVDPLKGVQWACPYPSRKSHFVACVPQSFGAVTCTVCGAQAVKTGDLCKLTTE